jgi:hypothetical protein
LKLYTAQFVAAHALLADHLVLDQLFEREPLIAGAAADHKSQQKLADKRGWLPELAGRVVAHRAGCEVVSFELVGQTPGAVELATLVIHAFNRVVHDF